MRTGYSICSKGRANMSWPSSSRISLKFAVIRHPIDRFLSAYTDKCLRDCKHLCYDCGTDINCFIERFNSIIRYSSYDSSYYLDELTYHLAPLNWWEIFSSLFWYRNCFVGSVLFCFVLYYCRIKVLWLQR
ncbi:unnamed protein product [Heligmosomoides polygyrus]|uniref:Sulfotransfer_1 domain-containing protein n=1 Tax=Heligmosomoides polygyrus TaxID=6339 RepID=A0A183FIY4_HELPZ|nr:unnamed protein product [Heligmosomoides polygyrus]